MGMGWKGDGGANELGGKTFHVRSIVFQKVSWGPDHVILKRRVKLKYPRKTCLQNTFIAEKCFIHPFK